MCSRCRCCGRQTHIFCVPHGSCACTLRLCNADAGPARLAVRHSICMAAAARFEPLTHSLMPRLDPRLPRYVYVCAGDSLPTWDVVPCSEHTSTSAAGADTKEGIGQPLHEGDITIKVDFVDLITFRTPVMVAVRGLGHSSSAHAPACAVRHCPCACKEPAQSAGPCVKLAVQPCATRSALQALSANCHTLAIALPPTWLEAASRCR
jgi:hypothetical protein